MFLPFLVHRSVWWPDIPDAIADPSGNEMEVKMEDRLLCSFTGGANQIHSIRRQGLPDRQANSNDTFHQARACCRIESKEVRDVRSRNHERVSEGCRSKWQERHPVGGCAHDLSRLVFASGYTTEVAFGDCAVRHGRHAQRAGTDYYAWS